MNGWSPATVTYAADGSLVSVTVQEPRFRPKDVAVLLASRRSEAAPRGSHGILLSEATNPETRGDWEVDLPTTDFAQEMLTRVQDRYFKQYPDADKSALLWRVKRKG